MARMQLLLSPMVRKANQSRDKEDGQISETDNRPKSVKAFDKRIYAARQICATRCPRHGGGFAPGFCERQVGHAGNHSHQLREGMKDWSSFDVSKGCAWSELSRPKRHHRPRSVERGPLDKEWNA